MRSADNTAAMPLKRKPVEVVVRRGAIRRFEALTRKTAELPVVVTWDRRKDDRREAPEEAAGGCRKVDRRRKPPFTWDAADFVVVEEPTRKTN